MLFRSIVDFVGPSRFQWTEDQVAIVNGLLGALHPGFLAGGVRSEFARPTVEDMTRDHPHVAVRSGEILGLVKDRFEVEYERPFHGTLLHSIYPLLNQALANRANPAFDSVVNMLNYLEDLLIRKGVLGADFVMMICRHKRPRRWWQAHPSADSVPAGGRISAAWRRMRRA